MASLPIRFFRSISPVFPLLFLAAFPCKAEEDILWPERPIHIDRSKQHYERLPPRDQNIDSRTWLVVPDRIKVLDSARFSIGNTVYRIDGLHAIDLGRVCRDSEAGRWRCGRMAAILLGNLVRSQRLLCDIILGQPETVLRRCQSGRKDVAAEMVEAGFALADDDETLARIEELARSKRSGLWRNSNCLADFDRC